MFKAFEASSQHESPYVNVFQLLRQPNENDPPHPNLTEEDTRPITSSELQAGNIEDSKCPYFFFNL